MGDKTGTGIKWKLHTEMIGLDMNRHSSRCEAEEVAGVLHCCETLHVECISLYFATGFFQKEFWKWHNVATALIFSTFSWGFTHKHAFSCSGLSVHWNQFQLTEWKQSPLWTGCPNIMGQTQKDIHFRSRGIKLTCMLFLWTAGGNRSPCTHEENMQIPHLKAQTVIVPRLLNTMKSANYGCTVEHATCKMLQRDLILLVSTTGDKLKKIKKLYNIEMALVFLQPVDENVQPI